MQYTAGAAKEAIRGCQLLGGSSGYAQALTVLESRFGNAHLVTEQLIRDLKFGKPVRSPQDIEQLADDIKNAFLVLSQLKTLHEVNSQSVILKKMARFPNYVQLKWKKRALKSKKANDSYPAFKELVEFASEANDPVYGSTYHKRTENKEPRPIIIQSLCRTLTLEPPRRQMTAAFSLLSGVRTPRLNRLAYCAVNCIVCGTVIN
ncbi:hypothetical protein HOLleu_01117 [Holothuria leucospilota]|uniref:Uncharacterized protein n=1 Tax=Holothuria leucospilota TaxID=206669 RepID=A0A9Q1CNM2_HOLLE|nr:hypothetical protein HOLleu_01117 [Holothuria leucospilota]